MPADKQKKVKILALGNGSRGDCQPIVAVLLALKARGFEVAFFTNPDHEKLTTDSGILHESNGNPFRECFTSPGATACFSHDDFMGFLAVLGEHDKKYGEAMAVRLHETIQKHKPDLILTCVQHWHDQITMPLLMGIPALQLHLANSLMVDPDKAPFGLPSGPPGENRPIWEAVMKGYLAGLEAGPGQVLARITKKPLEEWFPTVDEYGEVQGWPGFDDITSFMPSVFCLDDESRSHLDRPWFVFTGSPVLPSEQCKGAEFGGEQNETLDRFLAACPEPPVYLGWGSMTCGSPREMAALAVRTLRHMDRCGVVLGGWAKLSEEELDGEEDAAELKAFCREKVLFMKTANHSDLFPRCAAIVHHGGVGTTAASLRSGRPVIVTPVFYDQFDSGKLVESIGSGVRTEQLGSLAPKELAGYIQRCLGDEEMREKARDYREKVLKRNGAEEAAREVTKFWEETVQSGVYWQGWRKFAARKQANNKRAAHRAALGCFAPLCTFFCPSRC